MEIKEQLKHTRTKEWFDLVSKYAQLSNYKQALDIGTGSGISSYALAKNGTGYIYSLDVKDAETAKNLAKKEGYRDRVQFLKMPSQVFLLSCKEMFDIILVDGSHWEDDVRMDAMCGWDCLNEGGYMIFDDYDTPSMKRHVERAVKKFEKWCGQKAIIEQGKAIIRK